MPSDLVRPGIGLLLERMSGVTVVAESGSGLRGIALVREHAPDVVIVDTSLADTPSMVSWLRLASPHSNVVILADKPGPDLIRALAAGAHGCVFVTDPPSRLEATIRRLARRS
jgi:DNA-binding NarL/FixJ family response regulator